MLSIRYPIGISLLKTLRRSTKCQQELKLASTKVDLL